MLPFFLIKTFQGKHKISYIFLKLNFMMEKNSFSIFVFPLLIFSQKDKNFTSLLRRKDNNVLRRIMLDLKTVCRCHYYFKDDWRHEFFVDCVLSADNDVVRNVQKEIIHFSLV